MYRTAGEPTRGLGEEEHGDSQNDARDGLHAPGDAKGGRAGDGDGTAVGDEIHCRTRGQSFCFCRTDGMGCEMRTNENAPVDSPLLNPDNLSTRLGRSKFRKVDEDLRRGDADCSVLVAV